MDLLRSVALLVVALLYGPLAVTSFSVGHIQEAGPFDRKNVKTERAANNRIASSVPNVKLQAKSMTHHLGAYIQIQSLTA